DVCAVGKRHRLVHSKMAVHKIQRAFQLVIRDVMEPFTPKALRDFKYARNTSDEYNRWTEIHRPTTRNSSLHTFQSFVPSMDIPEGVRVERLRADKGETSQATSPRATAAKQEYCWSTPAPTRHSKSAN
ncbi:unnamed protein product, partial [Sphacelaria rigidula]